MKERLWVGGEHCAQQPARFLEVGVGCSRGSGAAPCWRDAKGVYVHAGAGKLTHGVVVLE